MLLMLKKLSGGITIYTISLKKYPYAYDMISAYFATATPLIL